MHETSTLVARLGNEASRLRQALTLTALEWAEAARERDDALDRAAEAQRVAEHLQRENGCLRDEVDHLRRRLADVQQCSSLEEIEAECARVSAERHSAGWPALPPEFTPAKLGSIH